MKLKCPGCGKVLQIPASAAGKVVKCPCGKQLRVPAGQTGSAPATQAVAPAARPTPQPTPQPIPQTVGGGGASLDDDLFGELTDTDLKPVAAVKQVALKHVEADPEKTAKALERFVDEEDLKNFAEERRAYTVASRGRRIGGALIDWAFENGLGVAMGIAFVVILRVAGVEPGTNELWFLNWDFWVFLVVYLIPTWINWVFIGKTSSSLGKLMVGTMIVDGYSGQPSDFDQAVNQRRFGWNAKLAIPFLGAYYGVVNTFSIFRDSLRTLRDEHANTMVALRNPR
ncbi:MAG: RDD family protein [Planctomycetota bacterium]